MPMLKRIAALCVVVLATGCDPGNACDRYGFKRGTTEFAQCVQNEELTQRQIYARNAR
jgi:hypothetical protein